MLHNACVLIDIDWLDDMFWSLKWMKCVVLWCAVGQQNGELTWAMFK